VTADRDALDAAISEHAAPGPGMLLTAWVLVAEWAAPDGTRHLIRLGSTPSTTWAVNGMLHDALYGSDWADA
jgi:hypothetical protein